MKNNHTYIFLFIIAAVFFVGCSNDQGKRSMPDMRESFLKKDKKPFGTYIAYHQLEEMFYRNTLRNENRSIEDSWKNIDDTASVYICIANSLYTSDEDVQSLVDYAKNGNDAFFAISRFNMNLLDKLELKLSKSFSFSSFTGKIFEYSGVQLRMRGWNDSTVYQYYYVPFNQYFSEFNKTNTRVLGVNANGDPDYIVIFKGKGRIFLHCEPRAFSNYFLLQKDNYQYLQKAFGYLRPYPDHVYWNEYYAGGKRKSNDDFSTLDEILRHPPLAAAFWLALILLLLFVFFGGKRRQRIIPVTKPNENTTVTFTETIGRLYLQKKDNKNIADKMITYFNEYICNNYFLNTNLVNDDFITTLSRKSGVARDKIDSLYRAIGHAHANASVDDYQLLSLNEQIQNFYKTIN